MARSRWLTVVAVVIALLLVAALLAAITRSTTSPSSSPGAVGAAAPETLDGAASVPRIDPFAEVPVPGGTSGLPARRSARKREVAERPWPARVAARGPWSSTLAGRGDRVVLTAPGAIAGGIAAATVTFGSDDPRQDPPPENKLLLLPDGSRWYPLGRIRLEGLGSVEFTSMAAHGSKVAVVAPSLEAVIKGAHGRAVGVGTFVQPGGLKVDRLPLPSGTEVVVTCEQQAGRPPCAPGPPPALPVELVAGPLVSLRAGGDGEAAIAGSARASAIGRTWEGLVAAIEGSQLEVAASYEDDQWVLSANGRSSRQVWVEAWPVVDTLLEATSTRRSPGFIDVLKGDTYSTGIQWTNVGFATSQIFEAEGTGPGATSVRFDLNKTVGHDAGLGVTRGDRVVNMRGGGDIDSNLAPGESVDRGLSVDPGSSPTIILRGNFPEVRVPLAVPPA